MKKIYTIIISIIMAECILLTGCGGSKGSNTANSTENQAGLSSQAALTSSASELSWKKDTSPVTFSCYIDFPWYFMDTWGNDEVSKEITKRTGVSLKVTKGNDPNQLQVLLASEELPELVFTDNQEERFGNADVSYAWDELIKKNAPEFMNLINSVEITNNAAADGHFYTLRTHYTSDTELKDPRYIPSVGNPGFFVRQDIMEALGNPKLESFDDLLNVFQQVKEKYPDMLVYLPHFFFTNALMDFMGLNEYNPYLDTDGKIHVGFDNPLFKDYYKFLNKLYLKGYMSKESYAYKTEQFNQIISSGKVFSASYNTELADSINRVYDTNGIKAHLVPVIKPLTYNGKTLCKPIDSSIGWASFFITKKNKNPERAIKFVEFLKSEEGQKLTQWGIEGKQYSLSPEGYITRPKGFNSLKMADTGVTGWYFQASGLYEAISFSSRKVDDPKYSSLVDLLSERKKLTVRDPALSFTTPQADSDEYNISVKLKQLCQDTSIQIITAGSEAECMAKYDKMLEQARKIGMDKLETFMTDNYNKAKVKYGASK
jgi:putative aldouronate transport system substrate-binding protein